MSTTLKRKLNVRNGIRGSIDQLAKKSSDLLRSYDDDLKEELATNCKILKEQLDKLKDLDAELLQYLEDDALEKDIIESSMFATKFQVLVAQIEAKTKVSSDPPPQNLKEPTKNKAVRLPYLHLQRFGRNPTEWAPFWDAFELAIDKNEELEEVQKFQYLRSYLYGSAARTLDGLLSTNENYRDAVKKLKDRFGDKQVIISSHMNKFKEIKPVKSITDIIGLRELYDKVESNVRSLESVKVPASSYGTFLAPQILLILPEEMRITLTRKLPSIWDLESLLNELKNEVEVREKCAFALEASCQKEEKTSVETKSASRSNNRQSQATAATLFSDARRSQEKENIHSYCLPQP